MLLRKPDQTTLAPPLVIEAAGLRYEQTAQLLYLGGTLRKRRPPLARNRPTDPSHAGMP